MIWNSEKTMLRAMVLLALAAAGCGDDDGSTDMGTPDASSDMAAADGSSDGGPMDLGTDTTTDGAEIDMAVDAGGMLTARTMAAIETSCAKLVTECMIPSFASAAECERTLGDELRDLSDACQDANAGVFECGAMAECSVLEDDAMFAEYAEMNCSAQTAAVTDACM